MDAAVVFVGRITRKESDAKEIVSDIIIQFNIVGPIANLKGHYFQPSLSVCLCVCL